MTQEELNSIPHVIACIDGSRHSKAVCDYAAWISRRVQAPLKLLHNIEHRQPPAVADLSGNIGLGSQEQLLQELTDLEQQRSKLMLQKGKLMLEAAKERVMAAGIESPITKQRHGSLAESLIELEAEIRVLVLGVRGEGHEDTPKYLGTQLESTARALHQPMFVVNGDFIEPKMTMLAYDGSEGSRKALHMMAKSPLFRGLPCHLVHVSNDEQQAEGLLSEAAQVLKEAGLEVHTARLSGKVDDALCEYQTIHKIDLTIMGAFSHNRLRDLLLGSFTAKMLMTTQKPLLLLR